MSGSDTADSANPATFASNDVPVGHEPAFAAPSTFLSQTRPVAPPKPLTPLDKEQMEGLVRHQAAPRLLGSAWNIRADT